MDGHDPRSDQELVGAANRGEAAAFEALYLRYRDWAYRLAYRFSGSHDDALDALQDTFIYLLRKFPGFRLDARMTTFLYPVVKHVALTRRRGRRETVRDDAVLADLPAGPAPPDASERTELAEVLKTLPEPQREVLLMRFLDDMSMAEIASALSIPAGTVKSRLHHALATLRDDPRTRRYFEP